MPQKNNSSLIIAQSGRALAASARSGGWATHVLDRFADLDTASAALSCQVVSGDDDGFHVDELMEKLAPFLRIPLQGVIYGSGLERHYDVLEFLHKHWTLLGNESAVVESCKNPALFFSTLTRLGIPHPQTSLTTPQAYNGRENWLIKKTGACGGGHVCVSDEKIPAGATYYYQKKLTGRSLSVVFLADGFNATIVGFNEIWTVGLGQDDFRYSGAVTKPDLPEATKRTLEEIVCILVKELGLQGLCGMDVLIDEHAQCYVLEINPRPPATFELHQTQQSLYEAHIMACRGKLPTLSPGAQLLRAHQVWYADRDFLVSECVWPEWVSDRPRAGRLIRNGAPICVVHAEATCINNIRTLLCSRLAEIRASAGLHQLAA